MRRRLTTDHDFTGFHVGESEIQLRDYQKEAVDSVWNYMRSTPAGKNPLVVAPTGSGKSMINAALCHEAWKIAAGTRIVMLTHVQELVEQNEAALLRYWPDAPVGVFSAGLGRKEPKAPILFGGVQSVCRAIPEIGYADFLMVDESHLIPKAGDGQYRKAIQAFRELNPRIRVIGLTATPFRTDSGYLHQGEGALFDDICYDIPILDLMDRGHISRLTTKGGGRANISTEGVQKLAGDYNGRQLQIRAMEGESVSRAVDDIISRSSGRRGWLLFASGKEHAEMLRDEVRSRGVSCEMVLGDTQKGERDRLLRDYKAMRIKCMVSVGVLTTGFDAPHIDLIGLLRPTISPGLHIQMVGRGLRVAEGKEDCLVLDYAGNIERHGPLDAIKVREPGEGEGEAPMKECPACQEHVPAGKMVCPSCGHEFPPRDIVKHEERASSLAVVSNDERPESEWLQVETTRLRRHRKAGKPDSVKVSHQVGLVREINEWVCPEHSPFNKVQAERFWFRHGGDAPAPATTDEWLDRSGELSMPLRIQVSNKGKFSNVTEREFREPGDDEARDSALTADPNSPLDVDLDDLPF